MIRHSVVVALPIDERLQKAILRCLSNVPGVIAVQNQGKQAAITISYSGSEERQTILSNISRYAC